MTTDTTPASDTAATTDDVEAAGRALYLLRQTEARANVARALDPPAVA